MEILLMEAKPQAMSHWLFTQSPIREGQIQERALHSNICFRDTVRSRSLITKLMVITFYFKFSKLAMFVCAKEFKVIHFLSCLVWCIQECMGKLQSHTFYNLYFHNHKLGICWNQRLIYVKEGSLTTAFQECHVITPHWRITLMSRIPWILPRTESFVEKIFKDVCMYPWHS